MPPPRQIILNSLLSLNCLKTTAFFNIYQDKKILSAYTLAEVLVTLGIIGIVASLTIPQIVQNYKEKVYKNEYKKAFSDLSQVFTTAINNSELLTRTTDYDKNATTSEWEAIKKYIKYTKECSPKDLYSCWADGDKFGNMPNNNSGAYSIIDIRGRSWTVYYPYQNIYLVDTNGLKGPNQFGKDRFPLALGDKNGNRIQQGDAVKVIPLRDEPNKNSWCTNPPCYYKSWLIE